MGATPLVSYSRRVIGANALVPGINASWWAVAGRSVYYVRDEGAKSIWVLRLDTGRQFEYVRFPKGLGPVPYGTTITCLKTRNCFILSKQTARNPT